MSVGKIAFGVFLGNLMFGLLTAFVLSVVIEDPELTAAKARVNASYNAMQRQNSH